MNKNRNKYCYTGLYTCQNQPCTCQKSERIDKFTEILNRLTTAAETIDYENQISVIINSLSTVGLLISLN